MKKKPNPHHHHYHHHPPRNRNRNNNNNSVFGLLQGLIFCRSRRLGRQLLPFVSALVGCFLFLFAIASFLSPPFDHHRVHRFRYNYSLKEEIEDKLDFRSHIGNTSTFLVPRAGGSLGDEIWTSCQSNNYYGCSQKSDTFQDADEKTDPSRFLMIATSGGLNQQRTGIIDAVVAAYILNSTLVVPKLDNKSYWKDESNFSDVFDVDWFISYLSKDIRIVKELPTIEGKKFHPCRKLVPRKCDLECYESRVLPLFEKKKAVMLTKFDYRLSNTLDTELQKLRCRANYHALRYTDPIREMGEKLVKRMQMKSERYIALHLRFESDMLAFSGCYFGGGDTERKELEQIRTRWETLPKRSPDKERRLGKCPLTPEEVGLLLRALGYGEDVHIYVASGEIYGGEYTLSPLKQLFPNFHCKDTLATKEELAPFASYPSCMAALDFIVCNESDIFVTNNNGNMAKILAGRRKYFGYKTTIRPNAKKLYRLFLERGNMTWEEFASRVRTHQIGFMGRPNELKPGKGEFHENPIACICEYQTINQSQVLVETHNQSQCQFPSQSQQSSQCQKQVSYQCQSQVPNETENQRQCQFSNPSQVSSQSQNHRKVSNLSQCQVPLQSQCQNQNGPNSHDVQANQCNINESKVIVEKPPTKDEPNNSLAQHIMSKNGTRVEELLGRNKNDSGYCEVKECHETNS